MAFFVGLDYEELPCVVICVPLTLYMLLEGASCCVASPAAGAMLVLPLPLAPEMPPLFNAVVTLGWGSEFLAATTNALSSGKGTVGLGIGCNALSCKQTIRVSTENRCMAPRGGVNRCYFQILMLFRFRLDTKVNSLDMQLW